MSNAIIKQQGDFPVVADNVWHIRAGAASFALGMIAGMLGAYALVRARRTGAVAKPPTPRGWQPPERYRGLPVVTPGFVRAARRQRPAGSTSGRSTTRPTCVACWATGWTAS